MLQFNQPLPGYPGGGSGLAMSLSQVLPHALYGCNSAHDGKLVPADALPCPFAGALPRVSCLVLPVIRKWDHLRQLGWEPPGKQRVHLLWRPGDGGSVSDPQRQWRHILCW